MNKSKIRYALDNMPDKLGKGKLFDSKTKLHDPVGHLARLAGLPQPKMYDQRNLTSGEKELICEYYGITNGHLTDLMSVADYSDDGNRVTSVVALIESWMDDE